MRRRFQQVEVFSDESCQGNPVAVVLDAEGLSAEEMQRFARWTNLSETTFVMPPTVPDADYRVRIFTPAEELPFAGHPTIGTCLAWLSTQGDGGEREWVLQECAAGLVQLRRMGGRLAFAAPPLIRSGPVGVETIEQVANALHIGRENIVDTHWVDNGPGWVAVLLADAESVLALTPGFVGDLLVGVVGPHSPGSSDAVEVRAFFPVNGATVEDPVTGSLNASLAQWLVGSGRLHFPYTARQGTAIGRRGRVFLSQDADGTIWVAGDAVSRIEGFLEV